jgi:uncharacterized membrane protein YgcG
MGTAGRSAPLRRAGSLLGLLGLELGAVLALHWLGRFPGLRIRWDQPVPWVLSSPVQEVLGSVLRTVGLVMAYWLLASTVLYLLASLTRLPSAVRAVGWATLPLARRVADHAVAVTLATSMVGGTTLGVAGPALAADRGGGMGPPARKPVAAAQATSTTAYGFEAADQTTSSTAGTTTTTTTPSTTTTTTEASTTTSASSTTATSESTTTTATTEPSTTATTQAPTTTTEPPTTATTERSTTTTVPSADRPAPPAYEFEGAGQGTPPSTTTAAPTSSAAPTTSTTGLRPPAYEPTLPPAPGEQEAPGDDGSGGGGDQGGGSSGGGGSGGGGSGGGGGGGGEERSGTGQKQAYRVKRGDNLWTIARDHLRSARSGGSGEPTNREVAEYWAKVVEANRNGLRSGDPDLIYPDEKISLPPAD